MPVKQLQSERGDIHAESFEHLAEIAIGHCAKLGHTEIVCGPLTSGGRGNLESNLLTLACVIIELRHMGRPVFNQLAYELELWRMKEMWFRENPGVNYCRPILEVFYRALFESGHIILAHFLSDWESSDGAKWEHDFFTESDTNMWYLSRRFSMIAERNVRTRMEDYSALLK